MTVGLLVNIATSVLFLVLILQDQPLAAVVAGYAISVPYNIVATVGVWRSAAATQAHRSMRILRVPRASSSWRS